MKNLPEILQDEELYAELEKAYAIAKPYRAKILYRVQLLNRPDVVITDRHIWNQRIPYTYLDAVSGFIYKPIWCL